MAASYNTIVVLFMLVTLGFVLAKRKLFTEEVGNAFSKFVINFALPVEIFLRITRDFNKAELIEAFQEILLPLFTVIFLFIFGFFVSKILRIDNKQIGAFILCFASPSAAFIGFPIVLGIYGDKGLPYALLYYVLTSLATWTVGVFLLNRDGNLINGIKTKFNIMRVFKEVLSPPVLGFLLGGIVVWIGWGVPTVFKSLFSYIGGMTSPLAMLFIGITIYQTGFKKLRFSKEIVGILIGRYLVAPLIVIGLSAWLSVSPLMGAVCLIQASLPVSNTVAILTGERKIDVGFTDAALSYSLFLYLAIFPLLTKVIETVF